MSWVKFPGNEYKINKRKYIFSRVTVVNCCECIAEAKSINVLMSGLEMEMGKMSIEAS